MTPTMQEQNPISIPNGFDIEAIRKDFPILDAKFNGKKLVYLDSAATSQKPKQVIETMQDFMLKSNGTVRRGVYSLSAESTQAFDKVRQQIQRFINASSSSEIIFTRGTTESINLVATSLCNALRGLGSNTNTSNEPTSPLKCDGDIEILISGLEHHANIVPWQTNATRIGAELKVIPVLDNGELDQDAYLKLISSDKVKILALTQISNAIGTLVPIKEMITTAHKYNVMVLIDGAQAIQHTQVDVQDLDADFYTFSGHKIYGPTGIGVLYGKASLLDAMPPYHGGGEMIEKVSFENTSYAPLPYKFEAGTPPIVEVIGLGEAIKYIENISLDKILAYEHELYKYALAQAQTIDGLKVIGTSDNQSNIISFVFDDIGSFDIGTMLNQHGIAIRTGHHCAQPVMARFGVDSTSRISLALYNTKDDIDRCFKALKEVIKMFR